MGRSTFGFERLPRQISSCTAPVNQAMIIHPTEGSEPRIRHQPRWADLFSKSCFQSAESTGKYQYRLVSRSIMINCCRIIAWHVFFFFFYLRTIDATTNGCDFQNCIQSNRIPMSLHLSTLHRSTCSTRGGARVAVLWQSRLPRGFLRCVLRVLCRHQMIPIPFFVDANPTHMLLDHRTEISPPSTFKYAVAG